MPVTAVPRMLKAPRVGGWSAYEGKFSTSEACVRVRGEPPSLQPIKCARSSSAESITTRASPMRSSGVGIPDGRSDMPVPRLLHIRHRGWRPHRLVAHGHKILFATNQFVDDTAIADLYAVDSRTRALAKIPGKPWLPYASGVIRGRTGRPAASRSCSTSSTRPRASWRCPRRAATAAAGGSGASRGTCLGEACAAVWPRLQPRP